MDRALLEIHILRMEDIPTWGKMLGGIVGALGIRELLANWQKQSFKSNDDKDETIKKLRLENDTLRGELQDVKIELSGVKKAVVSIIELIDDQGTREALKKALMND